MAIRHHCDVCDKLTSETIGGKHTRGRGILLHVQFRHGADAVADVEVCAACARLPLAVLPERFRAAWERAAAVTAAGEAWEAE